MAKIITFPSGAILLPNRPVIQTPKRTSSPTPEWLLCGAFFSLVGGTLAGLAGALLLAIAWFTGGQGSGGSLHGLGSILLLSTIPALLIGGCFLDWYEDRMHKRRK
ncbi:MAG: hypothetical protein ACREEM_33435 [Blastocatellia bacterium]